MIYCNIKITSPEIEILKSLINIISTNCTENCSSHDFLDSGVCVKAGVMLNIHIKHT